MKPQHLELRVDREDGQIFLVHVQRGKPIRRLKNITNEVMLCLCADLSADNVSKEVARSILFSDGMECEITAKMLTPPDMDKRAAEINGGNDE